MQGKKGKIEDLMKVYEEMGFNEKQLKEIRWGLEKGLDVSVYAKPEFDYAQMEEIRKVLRKSLMYLYMQNLSLTGDKWNR